MPSQTAVLLRARTRAARNAWRSRTPPGKAATIAALLAAIGAAAALGWQSVDALAAIPTESAVPSLAKRPAVAGEAAMEAAFWIVVVLCSFFSFHVMELLFRHQDVRVFSRLPVRPTALLADRVTVVILRALGLGGLVAAFLAPLAFHGLVLPAAAAVSFVLCSLVATGLVTIGTNIWMGAQYGDSSGIGDSYSRQGGAFVYAPAIAFGISVVAVLMLKLGFTELVRASRVTNAFWLGTGLGGGIAAVAGVVGWRAFTESYFTVAAFFREVDEVGFEAVMDYQVSSWEAVGGEGALRPAAVALTFRRHVLQNGRRFALARTVTLLGGIAGIGAAAGLNEAVFPGWAVGLVPVTLVALVANTWRRLDAAGMGSAHDLYLPLRLRDTELSRAVFSLRETLRLAIPYSLVAAAARGLSADEWSSAPQIVALSIAGVIAVGGVMTALRAAGARGAGVAGFGPAAALAAVAGAASLDVGVGLAVCVALGALHVAPMMLVSAGRAT